jgi:hypothetical protein
MLATGRHTSNSIKPLRRQPPQNGKAEAAVEKTHRAERRALRAILDYEPSSANEALLLLEFAMAEEALGGNDDLRTVMES